MGINFSSESGKRAPSGREAVSESLCKGWGGRSGLPIYLLLDTSESMSGAPLEAVGEELTRLVSHLKTIPVSVEAACLSARDYVFLTSELAEKTS